MSLKESHNKERLSFPRDWTKVYLKTLLSSAIQNGYSPNCPEEPNGRWILSLSNLTSQGFNPAFAKPAPLNDDNVNNYILDQGDFLISRSNTLDKVGRVMLFRGELPNCSFPDLLMRFRINEKKVSKEFLEYFLRGSFARQYIQNCASGTSISMVKINKQIIEKLPILLPPIIEQQKIAEILSTWDEAIEKLDRLIELKEKFLKNKKILFIKKNPNDELQNKKLVELAVIKKGTQLNKTNLNKNSQYPALNGGIEPSGYTEDWNTVDNTIAISEGGNSCGYINFMTERFWSGGHCYTLLDISQEIENKYLYYFLKANEQKIMDLRVGSGLPNIQRSSLENFLIIYPSIEKQKRLVLIFDALCNELAAIKSIKQFFQKQKQGLMQKLLTGRIRVNG